MTAEDQYPSRMGDSKKTQRSARRKVIQDYADFEGSIATVPTETVHSLVSTLLLNEQEFL